MSGTAVFIGPSLDGGAVRRWLPHARLEPPVARGDLTRLREEGVSTFLLIDGAFAHRLALSPREVVESLRAGCRVLGAASIGAIRAAECGPAGMEGIGVVQQLYRWRLISSDDEVAVASEPECGHRATSVALINVRFALLAALRRGWLDRAGAGAVLGAAKGTYFSERRWPAIFAAAGVPMSGRLRELCERTDVKRRDAELAVRRLAGERRPGRRATAATSGTSRRYPGHDPLLGHTREQLEPVLWDWLLSTGRYRRHGLSVQATSGEAWESLHAAHELERELMRWYAVGRAR